MTGLWWPASSRTAWTTHCHESRLLSRLRLARFIERLRAIASGLPGASGRSPERNRRLDLLRRHRRTLAEPEARRRPARAQSGPGGGRGLPADASTLPDVLDATAQSAQSSGGG